MKTRDDAALLRDYRSGSEDAFRELAKRYGAIVYASCLKALKRPELAEDASQAVFLVLARKADRISVKTTLVPWLLATSRVVCRNFARSERRRLRHEQPLEENTEFIQANTDDSIIEAIEKLRSPEREAVILRFVQGMSLDEVGKAQGISEDAARMRIQRSLDKLRRRFSSTIPLSPSLLARLCSPGTAPASVQQLALRSSTMFTTKTLLFSFAGLAGIVTVGAATLHRSRTAEPTAQTRTTLAGEPRFTQAAVPAGQRLAKLSGPFTLKYRVTSFLPNQDVSYLTISSEGNNLLVLTHTTSEDESRVGFTFFTNGDKYYALMAGTPGTENMWVTDHLDLSPRVPFAGVDLPAYPLRATAVGAVITDGKVHRQSANVMAPGWPVTYLNGSLAFEDLEKGMKAVRQMVVGSSGSPYEVWNLSSYKPFEGHSLAGAIVDTQYDRSPLANGAVHSKTQFDLVSAKTVALDHSLFSPEGLLSDGNHVEYKIPLQARMNLNFTYRAGSTIDEQARRQDALEVKRHP